MTLSQTTKNLFDNRDVGIHGNESEPEADASDLELEDSEVEDNAEEFESEAEELEEQDQNEEFTQSSSSNLWDKVKCILDEFDHQNLKIIDFLDALSWGDTVCTQDPKIRRERTVLLGDKKLEKVLHHWALPPRQRGSKKKRPKGAYPLMKNFATSFLKDQASDELERSKLVSRDCQKQCN